jgi:hypothetical protein
MRITSAIAFWFTFAWRGFWITHFQQNVLDSEEKCLHCQKIVMRYSLAKSSERSVNDNAHKIFTFHRSIKSKLRVIKTNRHYESPHSIEVNVFTIALSWQNGTFDDFSHDFLFSYSKQASLSWVWSHHCFKCAHLTRDTYFIILRHMKIGAYHHFLLFTGIFVFFLLIVDSLQQNFVTTKSQPSEKHNDNMDKKKVWRFCSQIICPRENVLFLIYI